VDGVRVAYLGDGNNVCNSWLNAATRIPLDLRIGVGAGYDPPSDLLERAKTGGVSQVRIFRDPREAVEGAQVVYTDVWASMGQESEAERRRRDLLPFQVNGELLAAADSGAVVMHCLPAHRGDEITDEIMDGDRAIVFDQAENRLHAQKALLVRLLEEMS
jgi:ornithine carbamoyltransferase